MSDESVRAPPQDGAIDFSRYSTEQLRELQFGIDRNSFPQNHANLSAELAAREAASGPEPCFEARFSRRDGVPGWLEAAGRRSPFYGAGSGPADSITPRRARLAPHLAGGSRAGRSRDSAH